MVKNAKPENILFLDIETVSQYQDYDQLSEQWKRLWGKKTKYLKNNEETPDKTYQSAGIYAEFGKIICISVGVVFEKSGVHHLRLKSFAGDDEAKLLEDFKKLVQQMELKSSPFLCAHNGKEFDFPYIARRMVVNGIDLPRSLAVAGLKPWEVPFLDTLELWKFGDYKHYTSLELLTALFGIETPKSDMDGSQVSAVYYKDKNLPRIVEYCQADVVAIVQVYLKYLNLPIIEKSNVEIADEGNH